MSSVAINQERFRDAIWFNVDIPIIVGGAGGIGSWLTIMLARIGFPQIAVYDFDRFEAVNMAGQFVSKSDMDKFKVDALADNCSKFADHFIYPMNETFTNSSESAPIMCAGFDNMSARASMFKVWKAALETAEKPEEYLFIDGRLFAEQFQIFCVTKDNVEWYENDRLKTDAEIPDQLCTLKQTSHVAAGIASFMTSFITNHVSNVKLGEVIREVPASFKVSIANVNIETKSIADVTNVIEHV